MTAKIKLNAASGGGSVSLQAPSSSSNNRVFTLPDSADATLLTSTTATGKILQVVQTVKTNTASIASSNTNTYADLTGMSVAITPSSSSNKVLITFSVAIGFNSGTVHLRLFRDSTAIGIPNAGYSNQLRDILVHRPDGTPYALECSALTQTFLDSPNTTSATTYKLGGTLGSSYNNTFYINRTADDSNHDYSPRTISTITVMEVAA